MWEGGGGAINDPEVALGGAVAVIGGKVREEASSRRSLEVNNGASLLSPLGVLWLTEWLPWLSGSSTFEFLLDCDFDDVETSGESEGSSPPVTEEGSPLSTSASPSLSLALSSNFRRRLLARLLRLTV